MPELPEVQTIKKELLPYVTGRRVIEIAVNDDKPLRNLDKKEFIKRVKGQKITGISRRGKYLGFHLSSGEVMIIHLRMTGNLFINPKKITKYARVIFTLDNGNNLIFADRRRLGVIYLAKNAKEVVGKLGPEPLSSEFTEKILANKLKNKVAPIKPVLLDQEVIAGIGNMYADEALFIARIHPMKKAGELTETEVTNLYYAIRNVLRLGIKNKGASVDSYIRPGGIAGTAHDSFKVAHRLGKPCPRCGTPIQRLMLRHRGSYFCPRCQMI